MAGMTKFVAGRTTSSVAPAVLDPAAFKHSVPKTRKGKHAVNASDEGSKGPNLHGRSDSAQRRGQGADETDEPFGTDPGSLGDTTLESDLAELVVEQVQDPISNPDVSSGIDPDEAYKDGEDDMDEDDLDLDEHVLHYSYNGRESTVMKEQNPELYDEVKAKIILSRKRARIAHLKSAPAEVLSYPATTSGEPSIVAPEEAPRVVQRSDSRQTVRPTSRQNPQYDASAPQYRPFSLPIQQQASRSYVQQGHTHPENIAPPHQVPLGHIPQPQWQAPSRQSRVDRAVEGVPQAKTIVAPARKVQVQINAQPPHITKEPVNKAPWADQFVLEGAPKFTDTAVFNTPTKTPKANTGFVQWHRDEDLEPNNLDRMEHSEVAEDPAQLVEVPEPGPDLDYDDDVLLKMDFAQLQAQEYDVDPRSQSGDVYGLGSVDLRERLAEHSKDKTAEQQKQFFASLNIDQWEQAGDWFQERYADLFARFKHQRQEKRKLSLAFEAEIAKRHDDVVKKRKMTEDALTAMRGAGTEVLNTPKKLKQRR